ncbi:hypothetical protein RSO41_05925 [Halomonas sp. I1]|uniref:hypothetical protein n=1 Tax=Halomonas sp. I1 TaxID=393536 RepID=UPI0028DFE513|nr:hypothetical protein [Halomonas sp. I1]MDT8894187.1 hypothetical protein [Halomonas sp. I1]
MGTREVLQADLAEAFANDDELGQAYFAFTAERTLPGGGEYNPGTGTYEPATLTYSGSYWRETFTFSEIQSLDLDSADIKVGMLASAVGEMPQVDDTVTLDNGSQARVVSVEPDPLQATYSVHLRIN